MAVDKRATRLGVLALVGVILVGLIGVRLWFLQTVRAEELQARVTAGKTRVVDLVPERGRIFDADGRVLADNKRILTVAVDYQLLRRKADRDEIFRRLSGWIDVPVEEMEDRYQSDRYSPFLPMPVKEDVDELTAIAIMERSEDFPGVEILVDSQRVYPYAPHAAHVIGYLGAITAEQEEAYLERGYVRDERVGQFGVELSMEEVLHGQWGRRVYEVDAANRPVRLIEEVPPINGFDVQLTIDLDIQKYAEQALETTLTLRRTQLAPNPEVVQPDGSMQRLDPTQPEQVPFKAPAGSVVAMNYDTGQVIALASYPTFDNRWFEAGLSSEKFQQIFPVTKDPDQSILVNRAIQGRYNLGSTFKPFTAYAGMANALISPGTYHVDEGTYRMYSVDQDRCDAGLVRCVYKNALCSGTGKPCRYGPVNVEDALAVSSDTFFYKLGEDLLEQTGGSAALQDAVKLFGFGADSGIQLPYEFDGTVPDAELKKRYAEEGIITDDEGRGYYAGDNVQLAIGQGLLSASPLQLANGYAAIANQGFVYQPQIVKAIYEPGVPDSDQAGFAALAEGVVHESFDEPTLIRQIPFGPEIREPIVRGLARVITGPGVDSDFYHSTTGEKLFFDYPDSAIPLAGKTGTAQGFQNYPWNDSSAFAAFSLDPERPIVMSAYLEKSGYGSQAAAPVVKCTMLAISGITPTDPVVLAEPLDLDATVAAPSQQLADTSCYNTRFGGGVQAQE